MSGRQAGEYPRRLPLHSPRDTVEVEEGSDLEAIVALKLLIIGK
jgi:hypothetical protein